MTIQTSRRGFLKGAAAATATTAGALVIGFTPKGTLAATAMEGGNITPFVKIAADGKVTAIVKHFEMGQGTSTGLTTLIAEELGVTMDQIDHEFAPSDATRYNNLFFGPTQGTGGSTAMANSFMQYRQAGAAARQMLISAAAAQWGVDAAGLDIVDGMVTGGGKAAPIGQFASAAAAMAIPEKPKLKTPGQFKLIGNIKVPRKDTPAKINGTAKFAMDVQLPDQLVVAILRSPRYGGVLASFDAGAAGKVKGFVDAKALPNKAGVAVYASNTWAAFQARDAIKAEWDESNAEKRDSERIRAEMLAAVNTDSKFSATPKADLAAVEAALKSADKVVEQEFSFPLLAHAPMEPLTCTIEPTGDGVILHDGCQFPSLAHGALANVLGLDPAKIQINTLYAGGSFGRRATPVADYQVEAALAFALTDRKRPVKLVWSREDDLTGGHYRPAFAHKVRAGLDKDGRIVAWDHRICGQSIFKGTPMEPMVVHGGVDHASVEGIADTPYAIPGMHVGLTDSKPSNTVLWWRSVGHSHTAFVMEVMMDMLAEAAGRDPVDFRLDYLGGDGKDQQRLAGVLKMVANHAGWTSPPAEGRGRGIAVHKSFNSYVAEVVEVSRNGDGAITIDKVTCAVDCGIPVNPDVIRAQMEGGIGYGIGHVMRDEITLKNGVVEQQNFPDYEPLRIGDIGAIETVIVPSTEPPTGVGEPGVPPSGPALANAIRAVTGKPVTHLPMVKAGVTFA